MKIRFLTNEIRSDALDVNVFYKKCSKDLTNCRVSKKNNELVSEITLSILKNQRAKESEKKLMRVKEIISLIPPAY